MYRSLRLGCFHSYSPKANFTIPSTASFPNILPFPTFPHFQPQMHEAEHFFTCPYCWEQISMLLDTSVMEPQVYIEDCEVCCRPIEVAYQADGEGVMMFDAQPTL